MTLTLEAPRTRARLRTAVIDCDIHNAPPSQKALGEYMSAHWRRHHETFGGRGTYGSDYPRANPNAARTDSWPPSGGPPASDLPFLREQLLDNWGIEYGILNTGTRGLGNPDYEAALASAMNDWQVDQWLDPEPRLRASMSVAVEHGALAAAEIERRAADRRFVQILFYIRTHEPLGRRKYWPIYEAAVRNDLPIGIHFGAFGGGPITGCGFPSYYIEEHAGMATAFQDQVVSFVCEGVFERFPTLKIVLVEGGFGWLPALMWRLDASWKRLKDEVPHLRRAPSEYIREHFWTTTQPVEEPHRPSDFSVLLRHLGMTDRLMFATDYPHWDFDAPDQALPGRLDADLERRVMSDNARALYRGLGLPKT